MAEYTLSDLFGAGASQDATSITIQKSDLTGLTAAAVNTAESLVVALVLLWMQTATETNRLADDANRNLAVTSAGTDLYQGSTQTWLRSSIAVILYDPYTVPAIDPDNY